MFCRNAATYKDTPNRGSAMTRKVAATLRVASARRTTEPTALAAGFGSSMLPASSHEAGAHGSRFWVGHTGARHAERGGYFVRNISLVVILLWLLTGSTSAAPFQNRRTLPKEWPLSSPLHRDSQGLQKSREAFGEQRVEALKPPPFPLPQKTPALRSIRDRLESTGRRRVFRYEEINDRLDRLEEVLSRRAEQLAEPVSPLLPSVTTPEVPADETQLVPIPTADPDLKQIPSTDHPQTKTQPAPVPEIITESAVDRVALADSLFGSDQFEIALKLYLELDATRHNPATRMWIRYQVAACSRRLHNYDRARKYYRIVAGDKSDSLYPKLARWWLDVIQRRISYESQQEDLRAQLNLPATAQPVGSTQPAGTAQLPGKANDQPTK